MGKQNHQSTRQQHEELVKRLNRETHFSKQEVDWLLELFQRLAGKKVHKKVVVLERTEFLSFLFKQFEMTDDMMMDRVFRSFNTKNDNRLCEEQFVKGMSIFLRGSLSEQIKFAFCVYDFNSDGYITKEEIFAMFKNCFVNQYNKVMGDEDPEEGIKDMVDIIMKKLDLDNDFRVSRADFEEAVPMDTLLLECLGPCLPEGEKKQKFISAMENNEELRL